MKTDCGSELPSRAARSAWVARALTCAAGLSLGACDGTTGAAQPSDGGATDFSVGALSIHFSSGVASVQGGVLTLYLVDLPDACAVLTNSSTGNPPIGTLTTLKLRVAAAADGNHATVVPVTLTPAPGQASGSLVQTRGATQVASYDTADGQAAWTIDSSGNVTITSLDLGFAPAAGRITTEGLYLPACKF